MDTASTATPRAELEACFRRGDLKRLQALTARLREEPGAKADAARGYRLIGDVLRGRREFRRALVAYRESLKLAHSNGAAYGMLECRSALGARKAFATQLDAYVERANYDENIWSRLMLGCARLDLRAQFERLAQAAGQKSAESEDARFWFRFAKARALFGDRAEASRLAERAARLCGDDRELAVEIATIDYDMKTYWDLRYEASPHAPVPPSSRNADVYQDRTARDIAYLDSLFGRLFGEPLRRVAECGCGSGRLTAFLRKWSRQLDCYDISATAIGYAREAHRGLTDIRFFERDLSAEQLPAGRYDLVFDFTVVQHVSDNGKWEKVLANYRRACRPGGAVLLVERIAGSKLHDALHLSRLPLSGYLESFARHGFACRLNERTPWGEATLCFARPGGEQ